MPRLSIANRHFAIGLRNEGQSYGRIVKALGRRGSTVRRSAIASLCKKFRETGSVVDRKYQRVARLHSQEHADFVNQCMTATPDLSAKDLRDKVLEQFNIAVSETAVTRYRRKLGWTQTRTHYCQMIRDANKIKRLAWCEVQEQNRETFDDVIFTDESKVMTTTISRRSYRMKGQPNRGVPKPKHPYSVMVWGGISKKGATSLVIFTGIMKSEFYQEQILRGALMPFIAENLPEHHRFMQDNDPKHTSRSTKQFMADNHINWWQTPAESPDLNPIENIWHEMKSYLDRVIKPRTKDQLIAGIQEFWATVDAAKCTKYIDHLQKVIPEVIRCEGGPSGY